MPSNETLLQHRQLLDVVDLAAIATDLNGTIVYWNPAAERLYGWNAAEAIGRSVRDLLAAPSDSTSDEGILAGVLTGRTWSGPLAVQRSDGGMQRVWADVTPFRDEDDSVTGLVSVAKNVDEGRDVDEDGHGDESPANVGLRRMTELYGTDAVPAAIVSVLTQEGHRIPSERSWRRSRVLRTLARARQAPPIPLPRPSVNH